MISNEDTPLNKIYNDDINETIIESEIDDSFSIETSENGITSKQNKITVVQ